MSRAPRSDLMLRREALRALLHINRHEMAATLAPSPPADADRFPRSRTFQLLRDHPALTRTLAVQAGVWLLRSVVLRRSLGLGLLLRRLLTS